METLRKKLKAFESRVWRRMLKISGTEKSHMKKFGKELVKENPPKEQYSTGNITGWDTYIRHDGMLLTILEGWTMGRRQSGRRRIQIIDDIVGKESYVKTKRNVEDTGEWMCEASSRFSVTQARFTADY